MSDSTIKRKHQTQLGHRCSEWLEWRAGKRAEPAWHMPARRRFV